MFIAAVSAPVQIGDPRKFRGSRQWTASISIPPRAVAIARSVLHECTARRPLGRQAKQPIFEQSARCPEWTATETSDSPPESFTYRCDSSDLVLRDIGRFQLRSSPAVIRQEREATGIPHRTSTFSRGCTSADARTRCRKNLSSQPGPSGNCPTNCPPLPAGEGTEGQETLGNTGALEGTRTPNLLIRSQMLYPLSYERLSQKV